MICTKIISKHRNRNQKWICFSFFRLGSHYLCRNEHLCYVNVAKQTEYARTFCLNDRQQQKPIKQMKNKTKLNPHTESALSCLHTLVKSIKRFIYTRSLMTWANQSDIRRNALCTQVFCIFFFVLFISAPFFCNS